MATSSGLFTLHLSLTLALSTPPIGRPKVGRGYLSGLRSLTSAVSSSPSFEGRRLGEELSRRHRLHSTFGGAGGRIRVK
eukprot:1337388-Amorphochlora_amoeboformis.AAC.1